MTVLMNVAISADGKIGPPTRTHVSFGSDEDRRRMTVVRRRADAVVTGGATFRACPYPMVENPKHLVDPPRRDRPVINAVVSRTGDLPWDAPALLDERITPLVVLPVDQVAAARTRAPKRVELVGLAEVTAPAVLKLLTERGASTVLLESGGGLSSLFFHAGLVDELYLTVVPIILGGAGAPTPVDGAPWAVPDAPRLTLLDFAVQDSEVYFHYRVGR